MGLITDFFKQPSVILFIGFAVGRASCIIEDSRAMIPIYIGLFALMYFEIKQSNKLEKED